MPTPTNSLDSAPLRRFRPPALPTLAAIAAVGMFVIAGQWQQRRMQGQEVLRAQFDVAATQAPVVLAALPDTSDWNALRYRAVVASGAFDAHRQVLVDNRVHEGRAGYHVITPLLQADGRMVLVNRGWTPQGVTRAALPHVAPPSGPVTVRGRVAIPVADVFELAQDSASGPVWQNLDPARFAAATGTAVMPVMIEATEAPIPDDGLVRDWPAPDFGIEKHRIYMVQWYVFAALAIVLWLVVNLRRTRPPPHE